MKTFAAILALLGACAVADERIQHVVTLMFENRGFDHFVGRFDLPGMQGLPANATMPLDPNNPANGSIPFADAQYVLPDPCHSLTCTTQQIYGSETASGPAKMDGFALNAAEQGHDPRQVVTSFQPELIPSMYTASKEFAFFDKWYCDGPMDTLPNRAFVHSGTSHGICDDDVTPVIEGYPQKTIYEALSDKNVSMGCFFEDAPDCLIFAGMRSLDKLTTNYHFMDEFYKQAADGTLPAYSFLSPAYFTIPDLQNATDMHPSHSVANALIFLRDVYKAVRSSPKWNNTLLIVTWDEHGGFPDLDADIPSKGVPSPDGINCTSPAPFSFDRVGIRIPTLAISPWIDPQVVHSPPSNVKPTPTSAFTASSIVKTVRNLFNISTPLSKRDEWAAPIDYLLHQRDTPRTNCPEELPGPSTQFPDTSYLREGNRPVNHLQRALLGLPSGILGNPLTDEQVDAMTEAEAGLWMREQMKKILNK